MLREELPLVPLLVLSPTNRHAFKIVFYSAVLNIVGDNTNNGAGSKFF
jgi:hypothetical protein